MSKWTLEKILACDEIQFGTLLTFKYGRYLVNNKDNKMLSFFKENHGLIGCGDEYEHIPYMKFFRPDGTPIEPPKDKKKIKIEFWINIFEGNHLGIPYKTKESADYNACSRIACEHFEREIEVDE